MVQNADVRPLTRSNQMGHITPTLAPLHWHPIMLGLILKFLLSLENAPLQPDNHVYI